MLKKSLSDFSYGIFDADGTIFDSMPIYEQVFGKVVEENFGINPEESVAFYRRTAGLPLNLQFAGFLSQYQGKDDSRFYGFFRPEDLEIQKLVDRFFELILSRESSASTLFFEAQRVLANLHNRGLQLFLTSGTRTDILQRRIETARIDFFAVIMGSEVIPKGLEHIDVFARAAGTAKDDFCAKAFLVGDGPGDMKLAKNAGIYAIGLTNTVLAEDLVKAGANEIISNLRELIE